MTNGMIFGAKHWWMALAAIFFWAVPVSLWSQGTLLSQQTHSTGEQPFSGVDDSLAGAADAILASVTQIPVAANGQVGVNKTTSTNLAILNRPQSRTWSSGPSFAAARVDMLRPAIEPILRSHGVPTDLVAVVLVESGGHATALSPKGARGLWQLMPDTARRYGLRVDDTEDDRLDLFKATDAAAQYLHDLHAQFGDWKLALAAYNTGEVNVGSAILRTHTQDFDELTNLRVLPLETRNYVPRVLAAIRSFDPTSSLAEHHGEAGAEAVFASSSR
ncbi:MAG TPA: lytic transglycosylase domain-containing protein [Edaphobacter sp.]|uniref:lytic transglycosylase domain-containing protein n=1 Tax=Edaphobacter sp. TaxID=1934404 RepID=UPI002D0DE770|nr:lytic transglycosylase domain-containing protein [Edaphobacter sp.]HUZ97081.1 lytic transglycosylase domain-containing protein [Edaphobacter sp.]